jgi:hypothetical protein
MQLPLAFHRHRTRLPFETWHPLRSSSRWAMASCRVRSAGQGLWGKHGPVTKGRLRVRTTRLASQRTSE